ncbi:MAG: sporulation protein, partial [Nonomuraea sp.]|nr:sporulation protein [Nonomuraea sp.]
IGGQHLAGMALGVRTELAVAEAVDKGDLDEVAVEPLPSQLRVLEAFPPARYAGVLGEVELTFVADPAGRLSQGGRPGAGFEVRPRLGEGRAS